MSELSNNMPLCILQLISGVYYLLPEVLHGYCLDGEGEHGSKKGG